MEQDVYLTKRAIVRAMVTIAASALGVKGNEVVPVLRYVWEEEIVMNMISSQLLMNVIYATT